MSFLAPKAVATPLTPPVPPVPPPPPTPPTFADPQVAAAGAAARRAAAAAAGGGFANTLGPAGAGGVPNAPTASKQLLGQ